MLTNASLKYFKCEQCEYTTKRMFDLRRHQQRHTKVKPIEGTAYKCSECTFLTKWKRNMTRHMRKHKKTPTDAELDDETFQEYIVVIETSDSESVNPDQTLSAEKTIVPELTTVVKLSPNPSPGNARKNKNIIRIECIEELNEDCASVQNINLTGFQFINQSDDDVVETTVTEVVPCPELLDVPLVDSQTIITEVLPCPELLDYTIEKDFDFVSDISQPNTFTAELPCFELFNADTNTKVFQCRDCSYKTKRAYDLRRHRQTHVKPKIINGKALKCQHCSFITKWKGNMRRHLQKHLKINNENEQCEDYLTDDERTFTDEIIVEPLNDKEIYSDSEIDVIIETSTESFEMTSAPAQCLEAEVIQGSCEKRFKCRQCEYVSKRAFDLRRHEQRHTKTKIIQGIAYQCNHCSFITKWKRNMRRHMQKHEKRSNVTDDYTVDAQLEDFVKNDLAVDKDKMDLYKLEIEVLTPD